jgi:UDP-glucose 4-epimerase
VPVGRDEWPRLPELLGSGVDAVVHAAWDLRTPIAQRPSAVLDSNLMATTRLLEACREHGIRKVAYVSTCAVYGDSVETAEDTATFPVTVNGVTKLLNERIVQAFCEDAGIDCQIYRLFNTFGGNDRFSIISHLRRALRDGTPFTLNNGGIAERDFIHVDDIARIVMQLLPMDLPDVHMNVGTGRSTRISEIVELVARRHPDLIVAERSVPEARYSRADISRLSATIDDLRFVDVMDFVRAEFSG